MSVYCGFFNESVEREPEYTFESFTNFLFESEMEMSALFERATIFTALNEETTALSIPTTIDFGEAKSGEEVKKTILDKIKEIFTMLAKAVATGVQKLIEKVQDMYMKTNLTDKFVSQFKGLTTWENLEKCKAAGWVGIPTSIPTVIALADPTDSYLWKALNSKTGLYDNKLPDVERDIEPILAAKDLNEAKEAYNKFHKINTKFRSESESTFEFSMNRSFDAGGGLTGKPEKEGQYYFGTFKNGKDDKHYYPTPESFTKTKKFAEEGQNSINTQKQNFSKSINTLKSDKNIAMSNLKSYSFGGSNKSDNKEVNQISILYYKARYQYSAAMVSHAKQIYQVMFQIIARQHQMAIQQYFCWVSAIKRYVKPDADTKTAEA